VTFYGQNMMKNFRMRTEDYPIDLLFL